MELIVRHQGRQERVRVERTADGYKVTVGENVYQVDAELTGLALRSLLIAGHQREVAVRPQHNGRYWVSSVKGSELVEVVDPLTHLARQGETRGRAGGAQQVTAYMPGRVIEILAAEGAEVVAGEGVLVLEAMKMENEIQAERHGIIRRMLVEKGQAVEGGDPLFEIE